MQKLIRETIEGQRVLILGFGREGKSTLRMIEKVGGYQSLAVADQKPLQIDTLFYPEDMEVIYGETYQDYLNEFDVVFKSPGIVLKQDPGEYTCRIVSQTELFLKRFGKQTVGITGTKGKSTVTTLLHHILCKAGKKAILAGNIGIPVFDIVDQIGEETPVVLELSCHQLEYASVSPHTAVLLNLYEEHLDHYKTLERYIAAKQNIYANQKAGDTLFCNEEILPGKPVLGLEGETACRRCQGEVISVGLDSSSARIQINGCRVTCENHVFQIPEEEISLVGQHNYFDIGVVYGICREIFRIPDEEFSQALKTYKPLPHRMEYVGTIDGVRYYDDSISTICETTIQALSSIPKVDAVLIGGMDRGIDYGPLEEYLSSSQVKFIILMAETGKRIYQEIMEKNTSFRKKERLIRRETLEEAVAYAKEVCHPGSCCVLSPAAASYGIFRNFEERGDVFKKLVKE